MSDKEKTVTPVEEPIQPVEETVEETETTEEQPGEQPTEKSSAEVTEVSVTPDEIRSMKEKIEQLTAMVRQRNEEAEEKGEEPIDIPDDVTKFLTMFAEKPHETLSKVVEKAIAPYKKALVETQQQNAIDYIRNQKDFTEKMYDDVLDVIQGPDKHRWFSMGDQNIKLKDLPPRQKAEAALQILRERTKTKTTQTTMRPKPMVTASSKKTGADNSKPDSMLSAEEFAKKYNLKQGKV